MKNNIKLGLGILTVLATPFAVDAATGSSEAHAAQDTVKNTQVAKTTNKEEVKTTTQKQVESTTKVGNTKVETTKKENIKVEDTKKENTAKKEEATKKEETTKKDESTDKQASSVKTVSGKPQAPEADSKEKKTGWASNGTYYVNDKLANWWYDDGKDWYFFQNGKKHTGEGKDNAGKHYFSNGKYANGNVNGTYYVKGKAANGYQNGTYYDKGKAANWWYDDGKDWYFFQNGKKHTGEGKDNAGKHYFSNGKYANGYQNGIYYVKGKAANWWYDDGKDWFYFKDGKKFTGIANDSSGKHEFVNGKYAQKGGKAQGVEATSNQYSGHYKVTGLYIPVYDGNGKILSHISQGTIIFKDNRASASGRIPVQVAGLVGYVNPSQVQAVNSSTTFIPDYVSDGKYVYHRYSKNSSVRVAYHNSSMQVGKSYYSADGINFGSFKLEHPFQFSSLKTRTNYTAADINKLYTLMGASNSMLAGKGATFKAAEQKYGVNALYLVAHSALESAWGRSNIAKAKNNFFGIAAYDSSPYTSATKFDNVDAGILGAARWINEKYLSNSSYPARGAYLGNKANGMNVNYATAPYWGESIASIMFDANDKLGRKDN